MRPFKPLEWFNAGSQLFQGTVALKKTADIKMAVSVS
jgi:hypothetical protein